jgi:hypothetical protein
MEKGRIQPKREVKPQLREDLRVSAAHAPARPMGVLREGTLPLRGTLPLPRI